MPLSGQETRIETPLLRGSQTSDSDPVLVLNCHNETQDAPLNFKEILTKRIAKDNVGNSRHPQKRKYQFCDQQAYLSTELKLRRIFGLKPA